MSAENDRERVNAELDLLQAMYPTEVSVDSKSREITFAPQTIQGGPSKLSLRLPDDYPSATRPIVLVAVCGSQDFRNRVKAAIDDLPSGEEALDSILTSFQDIASEVAGSHSTPVAPARTALSEEGESSTVIVWLHHLLSTTKRKAILAPAGQGVSGVVKPGYPGVLLFTGPEQHVAQHVRVLRDMNWQAFQVRAELKEQWRLKHGSGIMEVESIAEVVEELQGDERRKSIFLEAMKIK